MKEYDLLISDFEKDFFREWEIYWNSVYFSRHLYELWYFDLTKSNMYNLEWIVHFVNYLISKLSDKLKKDNYLSICIYIDWDDNYLNKDIPDLNLLDLNISNTPPDISINKKDKDIDDYIYNKSIELYSIPIKNNIHFKWENYIVNYNCWRNEESLKNDREYSRYFSIDIFLQ